MADRKRVLMIGEQPELVDFDDPVVPKGLTAEAIHAAFEGDRDRLIARGYDAEILYIGLDVAGAAGAVAERLGRDRFDCVSVGGGLRLQPKQTELFEAIVNAIHRGAPEARLAFSTKPDGTAEAVARQLGGG